MVSNHKKVERREGGIREKKREKKIKGKEKGNRMSIQNVYLSFLHQKFELSLLRENV